VRPAMIARRTIYAAGYLAMSVAGMCAWMWPSPAVSHATDGAAVLISVWDLFLIAGGLIAGVGAAVDRWIGEYVGLPLLGSVWAVYGVSALANAGKQETARAGGAALIAVAALIIARWVDVGLTRRAAVKGATARRVGT
jgi:hypothetical protein